MLIDKKHTQMSEHDALKRFTDAQAKDYTTALSEIKIGKKRSHWMWYIFPQLRGLGRSETAKFYGIKNIKEAADFLKHPLLGKRLVEISRELLMIDGKTPTEIFGNPDDLKLRSCMTLFSLIPNSNEVFTEVLNKYYNGEKDLQTTKLINESTD